MKLNTGAIVLGAVLVLSIFAIASEATFSGAAFAKFTCQEVDLRTNQSVIHEATGSKVTLMNVGSSKINPTVIVDVDGIQETVTRTETVNGVSIRILKTSYKQNIKLRAATLRLCNP